MWRELIRECHTGLEPIGDLDPGPEFSPGATPDELADAERQLGTPLPGDLRGLLAETDGVLVVYGQHLIWSIAEIVRRNLEMRTAPLYQEECMPFGHLLFFGDAGVDGILFAFGIIQGAVKRQDVYAWYPIGDGREWKSPSLRTYIEWWLSGKLKV
jgi:hypothetical protein